MVNVCSESNVRKAQLSKLVSRYFYTPGHHRIIEEVTNACEMCVALKQLPKEILSESTGNIDGFGRHFSADVIERDRQQILLIREKLSSFTFAKLITNQSAETLKNATINLIKDFCGTPVLYRKRLQGSGTVTSSGIV